MSTYPLSSQDSISAWKLLPPWKAMPPKFGGRRFTPPNLGGGGWNLQKWLVLQCLLRVTPQHLGVNSSKMTCFPVLFEGYSPNLGGEIFKHYLFYSAVWGLLPKFGGVKSSPSKFGGDMGFQGTCASSHAGPYETPLTVQAESTGSHSFQLCIGALHLALRMLSTSPRT